MSFAFPALGAAIAVAGGDKIVGDKGYNRMFRHLGWSRDAVRAVAVAETAGGLMMALPPTRRLGGLAVAVASTVLLASELEQGDSRLALARSLVLLSGLAAVLAPKRRPARR